jgi:hypothetical protein
MKIAARMGLSVFAIAEKGWSFLVASLRSEHAAPSSQRPKFLLNIIHGIMDGSRPTDLQ